jgi:hypothetical protein
MASSTSAETTVAPLDLAKWRNVPTMLMAVGGVLALIGAFVDPKQFGYSWLLAFMFFLSLCLGALFLVLIHHLFDASWSVSIRRFLEHLACLAPVMAVLFIPIALLARKIYPWMNVDPHADHSIEAKLPLFTVPMFYVVAIFCFLAWWFFSSRLRYWSLKQDQTGSAEPTFKMRRLSAIGIFFFAVTLTLGAIMWMKALQHQWFSTMYGVYYFAGSVWTTLATAHVLAVLFKRQGYLKDVVREKQFYFIGTLFLAFTVFYAYIHFSQYFIIWNANMPEETFWYVLREKGSWWDVGIIIIFGHFFLPFLSLLRIDVKLSWFMLPMALWAWLMHWIDLSFNIMPVLHPEGFVLHWMDIGCFAFMCGLVARTFIKSFLSHPPYPLKDPRLAEGLDIYVPPLTVAPAKPAPIGGRAK